MRTLRLGAGRKRYALRLRRRRDESRDDRWKPEQATKLALAEQGFADLLWALAENSAQTDQVKRKLVQRKRH